MGRITRKLVQHARRKSQKGAGWPWSRKSEQPPSKSGAQPPKKSGWWPFGKGEEKEVPAVAAADVAAPVAAVQQPAAAPQSTLPAGWEAVTDPSSGKTYYVKRATGESSWNPPLTKEEEDEIERIYDLSKEELQGEANQIGREFLYGIEPPRPEILDMYHKKLMIFFGKTISEGVGRRTDTQLPIDTIKGQNVLYYKPGQTTTFEKTLAPREIVHRFMDLTSTDFDNVLLKIKAATEKAANLRKPNPVSSTEIKLLRVRALELPNKVKKQEERQGFEIRYPDVLYTSGKNLTAEEAADPHKYITFQVIKNTGSAAKNAAPSAGKGAAPTTPPMAAQPVAAQLPPEWVAATDPASGRTYYANPVTGQTSWELPAAAAPAAAQPAELQEPIDFPQNESLMRSYNFTEQQVQDMKTKIEGLVLPDNKFVKDYKMHKGQIVRDKKGKPVNINTTLSDIRELILGLPQKVGDGVCKRLLGQVYDRFIKLDNSFSENSIISSKEIYSVLKKFIHKAKVNCIEDNNQSGGGRSRRRSSKRRRNPKPSRRKSKTARLKRA